jgi:lysozyme
MASNLEESLLAHEGLKLTPYTDTRGVLTVGVGRNLQVGLSKDEALFLMRNDISRCRKELASYLFFKHLDPVRQDVLIELCFNLGLAGLLKFKKMLDAIQSKSYSIAANELLDSLWAKQVGQTRSKNLANRLKTGQY